jgi:hypothetical protein
MAVDGLAAPPLLLQAVVIDMATSTIEKSDAKRLLGRVVVGDGRAIADALDVRLRGLAVRTGVPPYVSDSPVGAS